MASPMQSETASTPAGGATRTKRGSVQHNTEPSPVLLAEHLNISGAAGSNSTVQAVPGVLSLSKTLENAEAFAAFMAFARSDFSEENLEFYTEMKDFKVSWDAKDGDEEGRITLCKSVIDRYLKSGASKQVCIGDRKVLSVIELAEGGIYSRDMFDEAQQIARRTLSEDIFPRFQDSEPGQQIAKVPELCE